MEAADILPLLEQLDDNVDDVEEAIIPLLQRSVAETSKKLPVLDKAKLHVLATYALEALIFCMLFSTWISFLFRLGICSHLYSLLTTPWCGCQTASSVQRIGQSETIFRKN